MNFIEAKSLASCGDLIKKLLRCITAHRQLRRIDQWGVTSGEQNTRPKLCGSSLVTRHSSLIPFP